ncbi:MAG: serine/threonine protein kinase [Myxococcota bacterium]|nr:serine/threonine protein kinase [Deltaproteobacteria bacterium]MDQ3336238.1 serine/threonine protein kinase [Myxococcota bacterium]
MASGPEEETAVLKMGGSPPPATKPTTATSATSAVSPLEALERDEILRTRWFSGLIIVFALAAIACVLVIPGGDPLARKITIATIAIGIGAMVFMLYQTQDPVRFRQPRTALGWFVPAICVNAAVLFFGVFSPAPMAAVLGLYFLGLSKSGRIALAAYVICAALHAVMAGVVMSGERDLGIISPALSLTQQIIVQLLVQLVMLMTIVTARMSRRTALLAVGELEQAVRLAAHREALLLEARDELQRAMRVDRGRFSEQTIGSYKLGDILGRGAMGEVYAAVDERSGAAVAIKMLAQASLANPNHVMRFMRELRTAATVESAHVVRVIEIGEHPLPYLVMERLEGATLADILRERRTLPPAEVIDLVKQVGIGISAAAAAGIVHRDLKPQNVFFDRGTWKVLDFGVARARDDTGTLTAGHIVGTPSYMAPEQARGDTVDHRTDLYALAAIAYRAFTGHPPFAAKDVAETLYRVVHTRPTRPTLLAPHLHPDVDIALSIGLAPSAKDRWTTAAELADALENAIAGTLSPALRARRV